MLVADNPAAFGDSEYENKNLNTNFKVNPKTESKMLSTFDDDILDAMANQEILLHLHHHAIPVSDYEKYPALKEFFTILSSNVIDG